MMQQRSSKDSWAGIVEVQELRREWASLYLDRGYVLLAMFNLPWYREGMKFWNIIYVVGRYNTVPPYAPPQRWQERQEESKMGETMG